MTDEISQMNVIDWNVGGTQYYGRPAPNKRAFHAECPTGNVEKSTTLDIVSCHVELHPR